MILKSKIYTIFRFLLVTVFLYAFFVSIGLMGAAFEGFGKGFADALMTTTANPFVALFVGIITTSIIQSSGITTTTVVGLVSAGSLTVGGAIPIIMGANIGTTITNTLVSLGNITRREEFRRSFAGATIHDFFNLICVLIFFPLELMFHFLEKTAGFFATLFVNSGGLHFTSPVKQIIDPAINLITIILFKLLPFEGKAVYFSMVVLSFVFLIIAMFGIVKIMKSLIMNTAESVLDNIIGKNGIYGIMLGMVLTILVQSSSITTSLLVPLMAAGVLNLESAFSMTIGANIGTTSTAILASFATGNVSAITIAFVHFLFNVCGTLIIYPIKFIRQIPLKLARGLGELAYRKRRYAFMYVIFTFFLVPGLLIFFCR